MHLVILQYLCNKNGGRNIPCNTQVSDFDYLTFCKKDILGFQVSMEDIPFMHILKENVEDMLPFDMFSNVLEYTIIHQFMSKNLYLINISLYYRKTRLG